MRDNHLRANIETKCPKSSREACDITASLLSTLLSITVLSIALSLTTSCQKEHKKDDVGLLVSAIATQQWATVQTYLKPSLSLADLPFYQAMKNGAKWRRISRIRRVDHHLLFELELSSSHAGKNSDSPFERHMFWVTERSIEGEERARLQLEELVEASGPIPSNGSSLELRDISAPMRFATKSYRDLNGHQEHVQVADLRLGVIGQDGSGAIESGWRGTLTLQDLQFDALEPKNVKRCQRLKSTTVKRTRVLLHNLNQKCENPLLLAAQRARYLDSDHLMDKVEISRNGGGREIRALQDEALLEKFLSADQKNEISSTGLEEGEAAKNLSSSRPQHYSGVISFSQALDLSPEQRLTPRVTEAILISPPLVTCVKSVLTRWSKDFLKRTSCRYHVKVQVKVEEREK